MLFTRTLHPQLLVANSGTEAFTTRNKMFPPLPLKIARYRKYRQNLQSPQIARKKKKHFKIGSKYCLAFCQVHRKEQASIRTNWYRLAAWRWILSASLPGTEMILGIMKGWEVWVLRPGLGSPQHTLGRSLKRSTVSEVPSIISAACRQTWPWGSQQFYILIQRQPQEETLFCTGQSLSTRRPQNLPTQVTLPPARQHLF